MSEAKRSSYCNAGQCIKVETASDLVKLSRVAEGHSTKWFLSTREEFKVFIEGVKNGEFDEFCND